MNSISELVIGIIHTVGSDSTGIVECLKDCLKKIQYKADVIKVSKQIILPFVESEPEFLGEFERISFYMDWGNRIRRKTKDSSILMKGVAAYIYNKYRLTSDAPNPRMAYIIDSIKHPDEVDFLRKVYGDGFHLIGITTDYENRKQHLMDRKGLTEEQAVEILVRDENEKEKNGQHTRDAYQQADYFINASDSGIENSESVYRLLDLLFGNPFITPTFAEYAMFRAYVASLRSADLSRQIGAVVANGNEVIAEGVNDCPRAMGGLYWPVFIKGKYLDEEDGRDYMIGYDSNKREQQKIIKSILDNLGLEESTENIGRVKAAGIGTLTEYGRVVHSEMEALLMCARNNISTRGCEMYVTTFPCHNCAKHIIAAGIRKVTYIEPYPKSKALEFYKKEISQVETEMDNRVLFVPFSGVGPQRFVDLFSMKSTRWYPRNRKDEEGNILSWKRENAVLRNPMMVLNYIDMEKAAAKQYIEETIGIKSKKENEYEPNDSAVC